MTEVEDVRAVLRGIGADLLSDDTIEQAILQAEEIVMAEASESVPFERKERATTLLAAYFAFTSYATEVERELGTTPPALTVQLETLKQNAERMLEYIRRHGETSHPKTVFGLTDSLVNVSNC